MSIDWDKGPQIAGDVDPEPSLRSLVSFYYGAHDMDTEQVGTRRYIAAYEAQIAKLARRGLTTRNELCPPDDKDVDFNLAVALRNEFLRDEYAMAALTGLIADPRSALSSQVEFAKYAIEQADECMKARKS